MADNEKNEQAEEAEATEQEAAQEAANGTAPEAAIPEATASEATSDKTDEIAATYERAKHELNEAVSKLRHELSELDVEKARQQARTWVEENPTLTVFIALGAGILVGRLISEALKPAPPPPLSERLRARGQAVASQARHYAHDVGDVVADRAKDVGEETVRRARELGEDVSRRAREMGQDVTRRAADVVATASEQTSEWRESASEHSDDVAHALHEAAEDLAGAVQRKTGHSRDVFDSMLNAAKSVTAALVVKKVTDWIRRAG